MIQNYSFSEKLAFSRGTRGESDIATIQSLLAPCLVRASTDDEERVGIDYVATLRRGAQVNVDVKTRTTGCSRYWHNGTPDLALEYWSVVPAGGRDGVAGWTLKESSHTDLVLFTYSPEDTDQCFLVGFQHLRLAFRRFYRTWLQQHGRNGELSKQSTEGRYESACLFVPSSVVLEAITNVSKAVAA